MKKYITLLVILAAVFSGCTKDESAGVNDPTLSGDGVTVSFKVGMQGIQTGTEIEPMSRAEEIRTFLLNPYKVVVIKEVESGSGGEAKKKWVVERVINQKWNSTYSANKQHPIYAGDVFDNFDLVLRPGTYKMLVVLSTTYAKWNLNIKEGLIVKDEENPDLAPIYAITYGILTSSYYFQPGDMSVDDVFAGITDFEVVKQEELDTPGNTNVITVDAKRMTTSFSVWLKYTDGGEFDYQTTYGVNRVWYRMTTTDSKGFSRGVNIFGEPYYIEDDPLQLIRTVSEYRKNFILAGNNNSYLLPYVSTAVCSTYLYVDSSRTEGVEYTLERVETNYQQGGIDYYYEGTDVQRTLKAGVPDAVGVYPLEWDPIEYRTVIVDFDRDPVTGEVLNLAGELSPYIVYNE